MNTENITTINFFISVPCYKVVGFYIYIGIMSNRYQINISSMHSHPTL
jgi:hypothetical protein